MKIIKWLRFLIVPAVLVSLLGCETRQPAPDYDGARSRAGRAQGELSSEVNR